MKTQATIRIENALFLNSRKKREYGCEEVTIGFRHEGRGDEIADFLSMDAEGIIKCYEIKVTLQDLKTDNKLSFYGDYNYLVVSESLYARNPDWGNYIPPYVGILSGEDLKVRRQAKKKGITDTERSVLKDSLLRSVYWKMVNYKDSNDKELLSSLKKEIEEKDRQLTGMSLECDEMMFASKDYETYYAKNHQLDSFQISAAAKAMRDEYFRRLKSEMTWIDQEGSYICPTCGEQALMNMKSDYCPHCGSDLRMMKNEH